MEHSRLLVLGHLDAANDPSFAAWRHVVHERL